MDDQTPNIQELKQFVAVVNSGSFTQAADGLGQTTASLSVAIKRIEERLGLRLLERTTRRLRPTVEGEAFYKTASHVLALLDRDIRALTSRAQQAEGRLVVSVPTDLARTQLKVCFSGFIERYPLMRLDVRSSDSLADLYDEPVDIAVRYAVPNDSTLIARRLASPKRQLCAAPAYLAKFGAPSEVQDLSSHRCIAYRLKQNVDCRWQFFRGAECETVIVEPFISTDDSSLARDWAVYGLGLVYKSSLDVQDDISSGRLIPLLPDYLGSPSPLHLIYPSAKNAPHRRELLIEWIVNFFRSQDLSITTF